MFANACRAVWNTGLEQRRIYRSRGAWINYREQASELVAAKVENEWLRQAPSHVLQQTLMDLDRACRIHGTWKVRWRSRRRSAPSFRFPDAKQIQVQRLGRRVGRVKLPKLGWVRFRWSRPLGGSVRSATVRRDGNHWVASFLIDDGHAPPDGHAQPGTGVGIDRGVRVAVACSDGVMLNRACVTGGEVATLRRLQQKLARQQRDSVNRAQTIARIRNLRSKERCRRRDFTAQTAHRLASANAVVAMEDLRIRHMTRSARGTVETPGVNVRQKAGLNRAILGKGWHQLYLALESKARYTGSRIVKVHPAFTSQTCCACGVVDPKSRESQACFRCTHCGATLDADLNAAKNILAAGLAVTACGDLDIRRSAKQEPAGNREELLPSSSRNWNPGVDSGRNVKRATIHLGVQQSDPSNSGMPEPCSSPPE